MFWAGRSMFICYYPHFVFHDCLFHHKFLLIPQLISVPREDEKGQYFVVAYTSTDVNFIPNFPISWISRNFFNIYLTVYEYHIIRHAQWRRKKRLTWLNILASISTRNNQLQEAQVFIDGSQHLPLSWLWIFFVISLPFLYLSNQCWQIFSLL